MNTKTLAVIILGSILMTILNIVLDYSNLSQSTIMYIVGFTIGIISTLTWK